jgi:hypothetical protein
MLDIADIKADVDAHLWLQPAAFQQNKLTLPSFWMENPIPWFSMLSRICACLSFSALLYKLHTYIR